MFEAAIESLRILAVFDTFATEVYARIERRGCGSMAERNLPKVETRVRFPLPAPKLERRSFRLFGSFWQYELPQRFRPQNQQSTVEFANPKRANVSKEIVGTAV